MVTVYKVKDIASDVLEKTKLEIEEEAASALTSGLPQVNLNQVIRKYYSRKISMQRESVKFN